MASQAEIVVVEDSLEALELLVQVLTGEGYLVRPADSGELALASIAANPPDLVLTDVRMPGLGGVEVCRLLREADATRRVPVILMSAVATSEDWMAGLEAGADDFVSKPIQREELVARIETQLALARARDLSVRVEALELTNERQRAEIAARVEAERELVGERRRLESVIDGSRLGTWEWNAATGDLVINERWAEIAGWALDELGPVSIATWDGLVHPDDGRECERRLQAHFTGAAPYYECDCRMRHRDGHWVWVRSSGRVVSWTPDGRPLMVFGTHADITDAKLAEGKLRDSEASLLAAERVAHVGHWTWNTETNRVTWSEEMQRIFAIDPQAVEGDLDAVIARAIHPDDRDAVVRANEAVRADRRPAPLTYRLVRPDGSLRTVLATPGDRVTDDQGAIVSLSGVVLDITELQQAQAALQESEQRLRMALKATNDVVWDWDITRGTEVLSEAVAEVFGLADMADEPQAQGLRLQRVHPDDRQRVGDSLLAVVGETTRVHWGAEYRFLRGDGTYADVLDRGHVIRDQSGRAARMVGAMQDVSERRSAESELAHARDTLEEAQSIAHVGSFEYHAATRTTAWSPEEYRIYGLDPAGPSPDYETMLANHIHPDDAPLLHETFTRAIDDRAVYQLEHRIVRPDGSVRWVHNRARPCLDDLGRVQRYIGATLDVTSRKLAEQELRDSRDHYAALFHSGVPTWTEDLTLVAARFARLREEGVTDLAAHLAAHPELLRELGEAVRVTEANEESIAFLGAASREELAPTLVPYLPAEAWPLVADVMCGLYDGATSFRADVPIRTVTGEPKVVDLTLRVVPGHESDLAGVVAWFRDITQQVHAREERRALEQQLQRTQRLESVGVLAGGIAHDFNNVLTGIVGLAEMAADEMEGDSPAAHHLGHVLDGASRARALVEQILTFCRQTTFERRPLLVHLVVREALRLVRATLPSSIAIEERIESETDPVAADSTQIHQVVVNLCTNAEYAMRPGGGTLRVSLAPSEVDVTLARRLGGLLPGRYAVLSISDTGCGMDASTVERVFDPFFTTKPAGEGTGLGLATTYGIITGHGGAIQIESSLGVGTTFRVYLPCVARAAEPEPAPSRPAPRGTERVLLVDDEPTIVLLAGSILESLGYGVTATASSAEALELLTADPGGYDLLLTDYMMPKLTGIALARAVHGPRPDLPILMMTGYAQRVDQASLTEAHVHAVVGKPFRKVALAEAVRAALDGVALGPPPA